MPLRQNLKDPESSSPCPLDYIAGYFNNQPSISSAPMNWDRVMNVYYMYVRMQRGVALLPDKGMITLQKEMRIKEIILPEKTHKEVYHSYVPTDELLDDSKFSLDSEAQ
jgi:hypothetical protein